MTPTFFCISDTSNSLSVLSKNFRKIYRVENFRANVLKLKARSKSCYTIIKESISIVLLISQFSLCFSDDLKSRRSDVRIAKDNSLMVEGHHFGATDEHKQEERTAWEQKDLSSPSTISLESVPSSISSRTKGFVQFQTFFVYSARARN